jgi:hypothetical protein
MTLRPQPRDEIPQRNSVWCELAHTALRCPRRTVRCMMHNSCQPMFEPKTDFSTDYALIATGIAASLIALIYLILV